VKWGLKLRVRTGDLIGICDFKNKDKTLRVSDRTLCFSWTPPPLRFPLPAFHSRDQKEVATCQTRKLNLLNSHEPDSSSELPVRLSEPVEYLLLRDSVQRFGPFEPRKENQKNRREKTRFLVLVGLVLLTEPRWDGSMRRLVPLPWTGLSE
jgi:hypothetical protein